MRKLIIEKNAVKQNIQVVKSHAGKSAIYGVLTGDGGGAGAAQLARLLRAEGIGRFAVGEVSEAEAIRKAGFVDEEILMLRSTLDREELELLQSLKTGALISAAAELGCIAAGGGTEQRARVRAYAQALGRAFQIRDDMLDVTSSEAALGKPVGSDQINEKSTFVTALGLDGCARLVDRLTQQGVEALESFQEPDFHIWLANQLARRDK